MGFSPASAERVYAFGLDETVLFKHWFDDEAYGEISTYYDDYEYRFEVPRSRFAEVTDALADHGYTLDLVSDWEPFTVVKRKYTNHPKLLFKNSVLHRGTRNFNVFVMKDREAVDQAVERGARPIAATDLEPPG